MYDLTGLNTTVHATSLSGHDNIWGVCRCTKESKKLSALLFFQFIYTKVGVEQVRHFSA
jgi:hypothetical protein